MMPKYQKPRQKLPSLELPCYCNMYLHSLFGTTDKAQILQETQHYKHPLFSLVYTTVWRSDLSRFSGICLNYKAVPFPHWRHSEPTWTHSRVTCSRWPWLGKGVGVDGLQRPLPTLSILWFCGYLSITKVLTKHIHGGSQIKQFP